MTALKDAALPLAAPLPAAKPTVALPHAIKHDQDYLAEAILVQPEAVLAQSVAVLAQARVGGARGDLSWGRGLIIQEDTIF